MVNDKKQEEETKGKKQEEEKDVRINPAPVEKKPPPGTLIRVNPRRLDRVRG
jgi:hypothetical protein